MTLTFLDKSLLLGLPLVSWIATSKFEIPYLLSIAIFYGLPGLYINIRQREAWRVAKIVVFSAMASVPFTVIVDFIGTVSGAWFVPRTVLGHFLNVIPFEDFLWFATAAYTVIVLHESTLRRAKREIVHANMRQFSFAACVLLTAFFLVRELMPALLVWQGRFTYMALGLVFFVLPATLILFRYHKLFGATLPLACYFFYLTIVFEAVATRYNQWTFPGQYLIPPLYILGSGPIPYEELFFVGFVGPFAAVAFYEYFDNDRNLDGPYSPQLTSKKG